MSAPLPSPHVDALCRELERLGRRDVRLTLWDPFLRGEAEAPAAIVLSAREAARRELVRWSSGRFPSLAVAVADAVFSRKRQPAAVMRTETRPFALAVGALSLGEFYALDEAELCRRTFACEARPEKAARHQSREGRLRTIRGCARVLLANAVASPDVARRALAAPGWQVGVGAALLRVIGMGAARLAKLRRNVGIVTFHPDAGVRSILAPYLEVAADAPAAEFERRLARVQRVLGMTPFEVERLLRYARAAASSAADPPHARLTA